MHNMREVKLITLLKIALVLSGCGEAKPLQPPPPQFASYMKEGVTVEEIKQSMIQCGYPNVAGGKIGDKDSEIAARENCMFDKGFRYRDGYKGICSLKRGAVLSACAARRSL